MLFMPAYYREYLMYNEDKLGGMIRNLDYWLKDVFEKLVLKK